MSKIVLLSASMALALLLACGVALAASILDQEQTDASTGVCLDFNFPLAQTFTAGMSGSLDRVQVPVSLVGSTVPGDLKVSIRTLDSSDFPSSSEILGQGSVPVGNFTVNDPADWMEVVLAQPASVSSAPSTRSS